MKKTVVVELFFRSRSAAGALIGSLPDSAALSVELVRGRMTATEAWLKLALSGSASAIEAFLERQRTPRTRIVAA